MKKKTNKRKNKKQNKTKNKKNNNNKQKTNKQKIYIYVPDFPGVSWSFPAANVS